MMCSAAAAWVFSGGSVFVVFLLAFGLNGLFQSTGWSNNVKAMAAWFPRHSRGTVMGFWCTCYAVGGAVSTALAGYLYQHHGWRTAFLVPAVWVAGVGLAIWFFLVERPADRGLPTIDEGPTDEAVIAGADRAALIRMLRVPAVWALGGSYFGIKLIRYSLLFWLPYYLKRVQGYDGDVAAYLSTSFEIGGILGIIATGWLSDRVFDANRARLAVVCLVGLAVALAVYRVVGSWGMVANILSLGAIGFLLFSPDALISGPAAQDIGGEDAAASAAGIINGMGSVGSVFQGLITAGISKALGWDALFYVFIALALVSCVALWPLARRSAAPAG